MVTYAQAKANAKKVGWSKADKDSMTAAGADILARTLCLSPPIIYNWAQKHHIDIHSTAGIKTLLGVDVLVLVDDIIGDVPVN